MQEKDSPRRIYHVRTEITLRKARSAENFARATQSVTRTSDWVKFLRATQTHVKPSDRRSRRFSDSLFDLR
jgi:hypothetical protein